jgi:hypothetical protein
MYLHHEKKLGFIAHPRTASSATSHTLMEMGFEIVHGHHGMGNILYADWKFFCTVRNPFDVLVSWYFSQKREQDFDLWLPIFLRTCQFLQGPRMFFGRSVCTHVMHCETLQDDFDGLCGDFGFRPRTIERRNVSPLRKYKGYMLRYNLDRARQVIKKFRDDFTENGYSIPSLKDC